MIFFVFGGFITGFTKTFFLSNYISNCYEFPQLIPSYFLYLNSITRYTADLT